MEEPSEDKHEYYNGKIIKKPGAAYVHNRIATNILVKLSNLLEGKEFEVLNSDTKIYIPQVRSFVYPDALVVYDKVAFLRVERMLSPIYLLTLR